MYKLIQNTEYKQSRHDGVHVWPWYESYTQIDLTYHPILLPRSINGMRRGGSKNVSGGSEQSKYDPSMQCHCFGQGE